MRALVLFGLVATLSMSACGDETGILVSTRVSPELGETVDSLVFYVGENAFGDPDLYLDQEPLEPVRAGENDNWVDTPYRLLLRPDKEADAMEKYAIGVVALNSANERIGYGHLDQTVGFVKGSITQWEIVIGGLRDGDYQALPTDCLSWSDDNGSIRISLAHGNDEDCDGCEAEPDINDHDPSEASGIPEICGNLIDGELVDDDCDGAIDGMLPDGSYVDETMADGADDNCNEVCDETESLDGDGDGFTEWGRLGVCSIDRAPNYDCDDDDAEIFPGAPEFCGSLDQNCEPVFNQRVPCFEKIDQACLQGVRPCDAAGTVLQCEVPNLAPTGVQSFGLGCGPSPSCDLINYDRCRLRELRDDSEDFLICDTWYSQEGVCGGGEFDISLNLPDLPDSCTYQIIGSSEQQGYNVSLVETSSGPAQTILNSCEAILSVAPTPSAGLAHILIGYSDNNGVSKTIRVKMHSYLTDDCVEPSDGLVCNWFEGGPP